MDVTTTPTNQNGEQVNKVCPSVKVDRKIAAQKMKATKAKENHEKVSINLEYLFSNKGEKATKSLFK